MNNKLSFSLHPPLQTSCLQIEAYLQPKCYPAKLYTICIASMQGNHSISAMRLHRHVKTCILPPPLSQLPLFSPWITVSQPKFAQRCVRPRRRLRCCVPNGFLLRFARRFSCGSVPWCPCPSVGHP